MICQDFTPGDAVSYIPRHANGNLAHPDVEHGVVTSQNGYFVFVRFTGDSHAKACDPSTLAHQLSELHTR